MEQKIKLTYFNKHYNVGMADWRRVYLLTPLPIQLFPEVYRGKLVYRAKGSTKRTSYEQLKKGLVKRTVWITEQVPDWLNVSFKLP